MREPKTPEELTRELHNLIATHFSDQDPAILSAVLFGMGTFNMCKHSGAEAVIALLQQQIKIFERVRMLETQTTPPRSQMH